MATTQMTSQSNHTALQSQNQTDNQQGWHNRVKTLALALTAIALLSVAGCGSRPGTSDGGSPQGGGTAGDGGAAVACDPLATSSCARGQGCYFDVAGTGFACAKEGSTAVGGTCTQDTDCAPKLGCQFNGLFIGGTCKPFCPVKTGSGCTSPDVCFDTGDGTVGLCQPCPEELKCGSVCCQGGNVCNAGVCSPPVTCDPLVQNCTAAGQACYVDLSGSQFICATPTGTIADGQPCDLDTDCLKSSGCYYATETAEKGVCTHYCKPGASTTTCKTGQTCDDFNGDGSLGYCK